MKNIIYILILMGIVLACKRRDEPDVEEYIGADPCANYVLPSGVSKYYKLPIDSSTLILTKGELRGGPVDSSSLAIRCGAFNRIGGSPSSDVFRTIWSLPDLQMIPPCAKVKSASLFMLAYPKSAYNSVEYVANEQILVHVTSHKKSELHQLKWIVDSLYPEEINSTRLFKAPPFPYNQWTQIDIRSIVQAFVSRKYTDNLLNIRTSKEDIFDYGKERHYAFKGALYAVKEERPYIEIVLE